MASLLPHVDPDGRLEYSVVFTDRALNHMSQRFQAVMTGLSARLKAVYHADAVAIIPGGGSYAMEAVARQLRGPGRALIIRNGWFSFRWTQIFDAIGSVDTEVMCARAIGTGPKAPFAPAPIDQIVTQIRKTRPTAVFAAHVETAAGVILPDAWLRQIAEACREVGAIFVLDCIASGALWVDMAASGVDVLISAPQKGWSGPASAGLVLLNERALKRLDNAPKSSFVLDVARWLEIMRAYETGGHAYHATMPTDALRIFAEAVEETAQFGFEAATDAQCRLGAEIRAALNDAGCRSVAAPGFEAPSVVVSYLPHQHFAAGSAFAAAGGEIAGGVPLRCGEGPDFQTFRVGLFGLDKLKDVSATVSRFRRALQLAMR
ncbi:MAG TPA: aminotransferase [Myxococcales bacterium]|nr:aminotransferase [Myxococcales bacterium]